MSEDNIQYGQAEMELTDEAKLVKELGDRIGYGNMMSIASRLWADFLQSKDFPRSGSFLAVCDFQLRSPEIGRAVEERDRYPIYKRPKTT